MRPGPEQLQRPRAIPLRGTVPRRRRGRRHPGDRGWAARASPRPAPAGKPFPGTCPGAGGRAHPTAPSVPQKGDGVGWGSGSGAPQAGAPGRSVTARWSGPSAAAGPRRRACASARRVRRPLVAGGGSTPPSPPAPAALRGQRSFPAARLPASGPPPLLWCLPAFPRRRPSATEPRSCQRGAGDGFVWRDCTLSWPGLLLHVPTGEAE